MSHKAFYIAFAAPAALSLGTVLPAQTTLAQEQSRAVLEELVVTGTRRTIDLQDTAVAGTVLTGDLMEKKNVVSLENIQYVAPGVTIAGYGSANTFNMRGVGRSQVDIDIPSGVQMYRDGVPMFPGYFQNEPYFDMAGLEVLRGPQGTVAGKSASGGALFIRTRDAVLGEYGGFLEVGAGNFDKWEASGALNVPVGETFAFRLAANRQKRDHYYDSIGGDYTGDPGIVDLNTVRLTMNWEPNEYWSGKLKIDWNDLDFGGTPTARPFEDPRNPVNDAQFAYKDRSVRSIMDLRYLFDNGMTFSSLTGYQDADTINNNSNNSAPGTSDTPPGPIFFLSQGNFKLFSHEFNLVSAETERARWVAGVFYQTIDSSIPGPPVPGFQLRFPGMEYPFAASPWENEEVDTSGFGNLWYGLTDTVEFELGLRYSHYRRTQEMQFQISPDGGMSPLIPIEDPSRVRISESSVDYKVGLNWNAHPDHFFYTFVARGHTTGGINIGLPHNTYDEVEVLDFEAGWKGTLLDGRLRTQVGAYYQILENFQGVFEIAGQLGSETRNADDDSTIYGLEANLQAALGDFSMDFGGAWTKTQLGQFNNVVIPADFAPYFPPGQTTVDLSKKQSPYSPEFTANVGMQYAWRWGVDTSLTPRVDFAYIGTQKDGLYDIPILKMDARKLLNVSLTLEHGPWRAIAEVTNATDQTYVSGIQASGNKNYLGAPRMYGVKVRRDFGAM